jgi:hypothetical protein
MNARRRLALLAVLVVVLGGLAAADASTSKFRDLPESYIFSPPGRLTPLDARATYGASRFPIPVRVTLPDGSWTGAQWKANLFNPYTIELRHLTCSTNPGVCRPPYFGWVAIGKGGAGTVGPPRALILVLAGFSRTPSVAATVTNLRTRGHGATYEPTVPVKVAGAYGLQFDGRLVGPKHVFVPFSPRTHNATGYADGIEVTGAGHAFRLIVLDLRGKTVVVFIGSLVLSAEQFTAFLPEAEAVVKTLRFPG